ncbi:uncharacterized protein LOC142330731 [Lycorma delicatula]|uniref:uncharacterized protein LOC142330731 n=1 Tax=Lycorma delicatula TaxID=130591 RepID=UPI003F5149C2
MPDQDLNSEPPDERPDTTTYTMKAGKACEDFHYNRKVLIGNWVEEQREYVNIECPQYSIYMANYTHPKIPYHLNEEFWKNASDGQGLSSLDLFGQGKSIEFFRNKSTVYDLAFHHKFRKPLDRSDSTKSKVVS